MGNFSYLIETNSNPGLGIRDIVKPDKDPVKLTVEYVVKNCKRPKPNKAFWDNIGAAAVNGLDYLNLSIDMKQPNFQRFIKEATSLGFSEATSINLLKMALVTTF